MSNEFDFYDESALVAWLTRAIEKRPQEVVFLSDRLSPLPISSEEGAFQLSTASSR